MIASDTSAATTVVISTEYRFDVSCDSPNPPQPRMSALSRY